MTMVKRIYPNQHPCRMRKLLFALGVLLCWPAVSAAGIGMLYEEVPVVDGISNTVMVYVTNTVDGSATVDLGVEGSLAKFVSLSQRSITFTRRNQIVPIQVTVKFTGKLPTTGIALITATDHNQQSKRQISVQVKNAVPIRFDFSAKSKKQLPPELQKPAPIVAQTPSIAIGDFTVTSTVVRRVVIPSAALLLLIAALIIGLDVQVFWRRRKS